MERLENKKRVRKAMVLAGGLGTRFLPVTLAGAKELIAIGNKPILMYHLKDLVNAGIEDVLIIGNTLKQDSFVNFINPPQEYIEKVIASGKLNLLEEYQYIMSKLKITYINQDDMIHNFDGEIYENPDFQKMGSSAAIYAGKGWAKDEPFIVVNGDDICTYEDGKSVAKELIEVYNLTGDYIIYGREVSRDEIYKYSSMILGDSVGYKGVKMLDVIEKPEKGTEPSNIMGFARYLFTSNVFDMIEKSKPRTNGEYCMTDVISDRAKEGGVSACIFDGLYFDCGSITGYTLANAYFGLNDSDSSKNIAEGLKRILQKYREKHENSPENK